jgi:hypothetical protein
MSIRDHGVGGGQALKYYPMPWSRSRTSQPLVGNTVALKGQKPP